MNIELGIASLICVLLAIGHTTVGVRWVLPHLDEEHLPKTPFGPVSMTVGMIRVTWFIVTIFVLGLAGILMTLALNETADTEMLVLRWFAVMWLAATVMALWVVRRGLRNPRSLLRLPVPVFWVILAILCWIAST